MITGATRGRGGRGLANHLADRKQKNDRTEAGASRGLVEGDIRGRVKELSDMVSHASSRKPLYHVHADPSFNYSEAQWSVFWERFEQEFRLEHQAFAEAIHWKNGREHRHRVYSLVQSNGTVIRLDHDYARREKLARCSEVENGEAITKGRHNRAVLRTCRQEGRVTLASALEDAGLAQGQTAGGVLSPEERAQQERTGISRRKLSVFVRNLWNDSPGNPQAFANGLRDKGMHLAQGARGPVLLDQTGNVEAINRLINQANKADGLTCPTIKQKEMAEALAPLHLSTYQEVRNHDTTQQAIAGFKARRTSRRQDTKRARAKGSANAFGAKQKNAGQYGQASSVLPALGRGCPQPAFAGSGRHQGKPEGASRRNQGLEKALMAFAWGMAEDARRQQALQQERIEALLQQRAKSDFERMMEHVRELLDILFYLLFGIPTQRQIEQKQELLRTAEHRAWMRKPILEGIISHTLKQEYFPGVLSSETLAGLSSPECLLEEQDIRGKYDRQVPWIERLNARYQADIPNPSWPEFLENYQKRNALCAELLQKLLAEEKREKAQNRLKALADRHSQTCIAPFRITDWRSIQAEGLQPVWHDLKEAERRVQEKNAELDACPSAGVLGRMFRSDAQVLRERLAQELADLEEQKNRCHHAVGDAQETSESSAKTEADRRLKANQDHAERLEVRQARDELEALLLLREQVAMRNAEVVDAILSDDFPRVVARQAQKIRLARAQAGLEDLKPAPPEIDQIQFSPAKR